MEQALADGSGADKCGRRHGAQHPVRRSLAGFPVRGWACLAIHLSLPSGWNVVAEISGPHLGALWGLLNAMGVAGAYFSPIFLGGLVDYLSNRGYAGRERWDPAFYVYASLLLTGACAWLFVNPEKSVVD